MKDTEIHLSKILSEIQSGDIESVNEHLVKNHAVNPTFVWTLNLSHIREVAKAPETYEFLTAHSLIVADGWPIKYLVREFESRKVTRIPGVDLVESLLASGVRFAVIGSRKNQVKKALAKMHSASVSELTFVYDEYLDLKSDLQIDEVAHLLERFKPNYVFLALGFPKQEKLFEQILSRNPQLSGYYLGIGGSFQMLSGEKVRAPQILQNLGLEWLWRLVQDPKRLLGRYFFDGVFLASLIAKRKLVLAVGALQRMRSFRRLK